MNVTAGVSNLTTFEIQDVSPPGDKSTLIRVKPRPIPSHVRWGGAHVGRDWAWFYVDFGLGPNNKKISNYFFKNSMSFQSGFAYFVGPARAHMCPYGPEWAPVDPFVRNLLSA